jgi:hypothetical protein
MATALGAAVGGGPPPRPPPKQRELSTLTMEIAACLRDAAEAGGGGGAGGPTPNEPVARRMRALLPQLLGTCVEAAGTAAGACVHEHAVHCADVGGRGGCDSGRGWRRRGGHEKTHAKSARGVRATHSSPAP